MTCRSALVVLDPNSDFVRQGEVGHDAPAREAAELAARDVRVFRPGDPARPLHARFLRMPLRSRAALLQIDPLLDADEFNAMLHLLQARRLLTHRRGRRRAPQWHPALGVSPATW